MYTKKQNSMNAHDINSQQTRTGKKIGLIYCQLSPNWLQQTSFVMMKYWTFSSDIGNKKIIYIVINTVQHGNNILAKKSKRKKIYNLKGRNKTEFSQKI